MDGLRSSSKCSTVFAHLVYVIPEYQIGSISIGKKDLPRYRSMSPDAILTGVPTPTHARHDHYDNISA